MSKRASHATSAAWATSAPGVFSAPAACPSRRALILGLGVITASMVIGEAQAAALTISGEAFYRERMALPKGARLEVTLAEQARADAPARVIASVTVPAGPGAPIGFGLTVDSKSLPRRRRFVLSARLSDGRGNLLFASATPQPWRPGEAGPVRLMLNRASGPAMGGPGEAQAAPWGAWIVDDILGRPTLPQAQPVLTLSAVTAQGGDARRGDAAAKPADRAQGPGPVAPPSGKGASDTSGRKASRTTGAVTGKGGCNGFSGEARVQGGRLRFGRTASTLMACAPEVMQQEQRLHQALGQVRAFRSGPGPGRTLLLLDVNNRVVLRLRGKA